MADRSKDVPTLTMLRAHREQILALAERYGAYNVRVVGSVARGDAHPTSDVDLLVNFREGASLFELSGFWQDLQELLGVDVDVVEDHPKLRERLRQRLIKDAIPL